MKSEHTRQNSESVKASLRTCSDARRGRRPRPDGAAVPMGSLLPRGISRLDSTKTTRMCVSHLYPTDPHNPVQDRNLRTSAGLQKLIHAPGKLLSIDEVEKTTGICPSTPSTKKTNLTSNIRAIDRTMTHTQKSKATLASKTIARSSGRLPEAKREKEDRNEIQKMRDRKRYREHGGSR